MTVKSGPNGCSETAAPPTTSRALEHEHAQARPGQVGGRDQSVVAAADDDDVVAAAHPVTPCPSRHTTSSRGLTDSSVRSQYAA